MATKLDGYMLWDLNIKLVTRDEDDAEQAAADLFASLRDWIATTCLAGEIVLGSGEPLRQRDVTAEPWIGRMLNDVVVRPSR
jgi:hypothetical protein